MRSKQHDNNKRRKPRLHPMCKFRWRKDETGELTASKLMDISENGLAFMADDPACPLLSRGDDITIFHAGSGSHPVHYAVVWGRQMRGSTLVGCLRLTDPNPRIQRLRHHTYGPLLARLRRTAAPVPVQVAEQPGAIG